MESIMSILFSSLDTQRLEAEEQAVKASREAVRAAEQHLTYDEFEDLWSAISDIERACELDSFTLGFRLGVQLTLEGLRPVCPTGPAAAVSAPPYPPR